MRLTPPIRMTLEKALAYIEDDELVEVTPKSIRLRKKLLDPNDRKRAERAQGSRDARPSDAWPGGYISRESVQQADRRSRGNRDARLARVSGHVRNGRSK